MAQQLNPRKFKRTIAFLAKYKLALVILIALLINGIIWLWNDLHFKTVKDRANKQYSQQQFEEFKLLARPYVWAIRGEMLNKNHQQIDLYGAEMIRQKGFESIMVSDADGFIISATDKKVEGKYIFTLIDSVLLAKDSTTVNRLNDSLAVINSPIMGFNSRLGTLTLFRKIYRFKYQ
ncbi:hypothetical protein [Pedobacter gandavensis]|uniref:hypothetical protein n=1 Tax=Pedobacter gandavensis TaxID=2679963 RepID=UPI00292ED9CB|nr:hypothetical protein [Pedobacter gandavensis]